MSSLRPVLYVIAALAVPFSLGGCVVAAVGGVAAAGAAGGYMAGQERGFNGAASDFEIKSNIQADWGAAKPALPARELTATVYEGGVLLTGSVPTPEDKARAQQIAAQTRGVRTIYDRIMVGPPESTWQAAKDSWITARLRSSLMFANHIRSVNYTIETVNGTVYLIGSARTPQELNRVTQIARYVPDVKQVVSYVQIRPGAPVLAQRAAEPGDAVPANLAPGGVTAGSSAGAAPVAPVSAQPL